MIDASIVKVTTSAGTGVVVGPDLFAEVVGIRVRPTVAGVKDNTVSWRIVFESRVFDTTDRMPVYDTKWIKGEYNIYDRWPMRGYVVLNAETDVSAATLLVELSHDGPGTA